MIRNHVKISPDSFGLKPLDYVIPMCFIPKMCGVDFGNFLIRYLFADWILVIIYNAFNLQSGFCRCGADQLNYCLDIIKRFALPVSGDITKQPVFDLSLIHI